MKIIQKLSEMMAEEVRDAEKYVRCALTNKDERPELAQVFFQLSIEELDHMNRLHKAAKAIIDDYRKQNGEPPESMLAVYEYLHDKSIQLAADVRAMQAMYRES